MTIHPQLLKRLLLEQQSKDKDLPHQDRMILRKQWLDFLDKVKEKKEKFELGRLANKSGDLIPCFILDKASRTEGDFTYIMGVALSLNGQFRCQWRNDDIWYSDEL